MNAMLHFQRALMVGSLGLLCVGCPDSPSTGGGNNTPIATHADGSPAPEASNIPKDAQFTLVCRVFYEESHADDARRAQQELHDKTDMKDWYVSHSSDHSTLYYGYYRTINPRDPNDGDEGRRAIDDQNKIRAMASSDGQRLFSECLLVPVDAPDPQANPAWDIARTKGSWSIEVGSFTTAHRKTDAVNACAEARKQGVEAYYYHGETASSLCVGCWPEDSAVEFSPEAQNVDPNATLFVTNVPMDPTVAANLQKTTGMNTVSTRVTIPDPTLLKALRENPDHATDGGSRQKLDPVTGRPTGHVVEKSFLFRIPHKDPLDTIAGGGEVGTPVLPPPVQRPAGPGEAQLRSIGQ